MSMITVNTKALEYIRKVNIIHGQYEKSGCLYIGLYDRKGELYNDLSVYIMPVLPGQFFVESGSEKESFCKEQTGLFTCLDRTVKQGFNRYTLYQYNGQIK